MLQAIFLHFNITTEAKEQPQRVVLNSGIMIGSWFLGAIAVLAYSLFALGFVFGVSDLYAPAFLIGIMYAVLTKLSNNEVEPLGSAIAGATTAAIAGAVLIYSRLESYGGVTSWFINNITALSFQMGIIGGLSGFIAGLIAKRIK